MDRTRTLLALLAIAAVAGAGPTPEGTWSVRIERPAQWTPRVALATLELKRAGRRWEGTIQFEVLMNRKRMRLTDIRVSGSRFSFRWELERFQVVMEGRRSGSKLKGHCAWKGAGTWPFLAEQIEASKRKGALRRFEPDADFTNYMDPARPEEVGADPVALERLIAIAEKNDTDALVVLKNGKVLCERYPQGWRGRIQLMSVTKFITSIAVAKLLDEKKIPSLDTPVSAWYPAWSKGVKARVTLRHLLAHTSGLVHEPKAHTLNRQADKVAYVLQLPCKEPGKRFSYSNEGIALVSGILTKAAGKPADAYLKETLFEPLLIRDWAWDRDEAGNSITYAQLAMTARDLARLGHVVMHKPPARSLAQFAKPAGDKSRGLIWRLYHDPDGYGHTGFLGQFLVVYPAEQLVGVRLRRVKPNIQTDNPAQEFGAFASMLADLIR